MKNNFLELTMEEKQIVNGGGIDIKVDLGKVSPWEWGNQFGRDVLYPYIWKPISRLWR